MRGGRFYFEVEEEFAPVEVVEHEVELGVCLEGPSQGNQVGVLHCLQNLSLCECVLQLSPLNDGLLAKHLHGADLAGGLLAHLVHLPEAPLAQNA